MSDLPLSPDDVAEIVAILDNTPLERLEIRTSRFTLKVARSGDGWQQEVEWTAESAPAEAQAADAPKVRAGKDGEIDILPPLPGTFYRAPQPGAEPFVTEGDTVEPETVVAIVETMKLMNPVYAGAAGTISEILAENATLVEAGTALMRVRPDGGPTG